MDWDERELVAWLRSEQRSRHAVALGIGDDMAAVTSASDLLLLSSDMLLDGVHFDTTAHTWSAIGRKALACSLSDCAAMAVQPVAALVSLALPKGCALDDVKELFRGMLALAEAFEVAIVGGDTTRWGHPLAIDVTVSATPYEGIDPVLRSSASPGDGLYVTGPLGGSRLGRHLTFPPRVKEAQALARALGVDLHAMMDLSDGLALDLWRLCEASGVGAIVEERSLQKILHDDAVRAADKDGQSPTEHALSDGEDFELLLAVDPKASLPMGSLYPIGTVTEAALQWRRADGSLTTLQPKGFLH